MVEDAVRHHNCTQLHGVTTQEVVPFTVIAVSMLSPAGVYTFLGISISLYSDGLLAGWPGFDSRQGNDFSLLHRVHTGSEAQPASYPMGKLKLPLCLTN
jgi:hypothetical protein